MVANTDNTIILSYDYLSYIMDGHKPPSVWCIVKIHPVFATYRPQGHVLPSQVNITYKGWGGKVCFKLILFKPRHSAGNWSHQVMYMTF